VSPVGDLGRDYRIVGVGGQRSHCFPEEIGFFFSDGRAAVGVFLAEGDYGLVGCTRVACT
jgi:hypothetical protein